ARHGCRRRRPIVAVDEPEQPNELVGDPRRFCIAKNLARFFLVDRLELADRFWWKHLEVRHKYDNPQTPKRKGARGRKRERSTTRSDGSGASYHAHRGHR